MGQFWMQFNTSEVNWLLDGLGELTREESAKTLAGILPAGFESYARIFHPAFRGVPYETEIQFNGDRGWGIPVTWAEVAAYNGEKLTGQAQWHRVCGGKTGLPHPDDRPVNQNWTVPPEEGVMEPRATALAVFGVLATQTERDATCFCSFWEGYGVGQIYPINSRFRTFHQEYYLSKTRFADLVEHYRRRPFGLNADTPDMLWSEDHKWFLISPFQRQATYVGGSQHLVDRFYKSDELEAFPIQRTDRFWDDTVNVD